MSNAAAVNRVLLIHDTPGRLTGRAAKIRRYRLARVGLSATRGGDSAPRKRR